MRSIRGLFDETKHDIDSGHLDRLSRRYRYFDSNCLNDIPKMRHPDEKTSAFENDMQEVIRCHHHPSLSTKFLHASDDSVESVFKTIFVKTPLDSAGINCPEKEKAITRSGD